MAGDMKARIEAFLLDPSRHDPEAAVAAVRALMAIARNATARLDALERAATGVMPVVMESRLEKRPDGFYVTLNGREMGPFASPMQAANATAEKLASQVQAIAETCECPGCKARRAEEEEPLPLTHPTVPAAFHPKP